MFRVTKEEDPSRTMITIDGQLAGDHIEVVEACCNQALSSGKPVYLHLRDVSTVDHAGCALLRRLAAKGVRVFAQGVYTSYLVQSLQPASTGSLNSANGFRAASGEAKPGKQ